jgi:hypothetical protein
VPGAVACGMNFCMSMRQIMRQMAKWQLASALLVAGCAAPSEGEKQATDTNTQSVAAVVKPAASSKKPLPVFQPDISCKLPVYQLANLEPAPTRRLDSAFVAQLVIKAPRLKRSFGSYTHDDDIFALDTMACQGFFLVSWLHRHEGCCEELYYLTFDNEERKLLDIKQVASGGADGDWQARSTMRLMKGGRLRAKTTAHNAISPRDVQPDGSILAYEHTDVVVKEFALSSDGQINCMLKDSTRH